MRGLEGNDRRVLKRFREQARRSFAGEAAALVLKADDVASRIAGSQAKTHRAVAGLLLQQRADPIVVAAALQLLHKHFCPVPGTFDDYIASPKPNGYQSLHTCIYAAPDISAQPIEIQIRTRSMDREAEFGVAAHWRYKSAEEAKARTDGQRAWLRSLKEMSQQTTSHAQFLERLRSQVYGDPALGCDADRDGAAPLRQGRDVDTPGFQLVAMLC